MSLEWIKNWFESKKKRLQKTKPLVMAMAVFISLTIIFGSTLAWYTVAQFVRNKVEARPTESGFHVELVDEFEPDKFMKRVGAVNTGSVPAQVRILALPIFQYTDDDDNTIILPAEWGTHVFMQHVEGIPGFNTADWTLEPDGYFYYKGNISGGSDTAGQLLPGEDTDKGWDKIPSTDHNLFNYFALASKDVLEALDPEYLGAEFRIEIRVEAWIPNTP